MKIKDGILIGLVAAIILLLLFGWWKYSKLQEELFNEINDANKTIIKMDKTFKEGDGQYAKLVNYFNTEKDLNQQLKDQNKDLYKLIKSQDEKLLMINNMVASLESQMSEGFGQINKKDTNRIDLKLKYPNEGENFITWEGYVNRKNAFYKGEWKFGKLPLQVIMTETDRGIWKSRLVGPEWLVVDSMEINSLPIPIPEKQSNFGVLLGGGYVRSLASNGTNGISIGGGLKFKSHYLILNATTNKEIGFSYFYNFFNFKKK